MDLRTPIREDVKRWWAERLTDNSYEQLREALTEGWKDGHAEKACCLGVLCGVAIEHKLEGIRWDPSGTGTVQVWDDDLAADHPENDEGGWREHEDGDLPSVVAEWAFSRSVAGNPTIGTTSVGVTGIEGLRAIQANDVLEMTFEQIAALVRELPALDSRKFADGAP